MITRLWAEVPEDERSTDRPHDRDGQCAGATKYDDRRSSTQVLWHQCSYDAMQGSTFCKAHHPDSYCTNVTEIEEVKDFSREKYEKAQTRGRCAKCDKWSVITAAGKLRRHFKERTTFDENFENRPRCAACNIEMVLFGPNDPGVGPGVGCETCTNKYPPALLKACGDEFDYAVGMSDGSVIRFHSAAIAGDWVVIQGIRSFVFVDVAYHYNFERGINVRFEDIRWVADAPQGS